MGSHTGFSRDWLISLGIMASRFIQAAALVECPSCLRLSDSSLYGCNTGCLSTHLWVELGWFPPFGYWE